jgi:hypothetical protein
MNDREIKALAARKGLATTKIGGQLRIVFGRMAELPTKEVIKTLESMPDFDNTNKAPVPSETIDLTGMNQAARDAIVLKMMNKTVSDAVEAVA